MDGVCHNLIPILPTVTTNLLTIPMDTTRAGELTELAKKINSELAEESKY